MMKMAAVSSIALLLLCFSLSTSADSQDGCDFYAATNDDFVVPLRYTLNKLDELRWKHGKSVIFSRRQTTVDRGRETDVTEDGSLRLVKVDQSKAGNYTPEVYVDGKAKGNLKSITLCIVDRVPTPQVKFQCLSSSVQFTCSVDQPGKDLSFEWLQNNKVLKNITSQTLPATTSKELEEDSVACKVSNHGVSSEKSLPVKQNCTKSGFGDLIERFGSNVWIFVGGGGGVLVLIVVVIVCCIRNRRKKRMQVKDEEELRLGGTNPNQQHHHTHHTPSSHHHHHRQQQPAGHTGPRQHRSKQQRSQQHPRDPDHPDGNPQTSSRRPAQGTRLANKKDEHPPPLPQPRKTNPKTPRV